MAAKILLSGGMGAFMMLLSSVPIQASTVVLEKGTFDSIPGSLAIAANEWSAWIEPGSHFLRGGIREGDGRGQGVFYAMTDLVYNPAAHGQIKSLSVTVVARWDECNTGQFAFAALVGSGYYYQMGFVSTTPADANGWRSAEFTLDAAETSLCKLDPLTFNFSPDALDLTTLNDPISFGFMMWSSGEGCGAEYTWDVSNFRIALRTAAPEPTSLGFLALGALALLGRR